MKSLTSSISLTLVLTFGSLFTAPSPVHAEVTLTSNLSLLVGALLVKFGARQSALYFTEKAANAGMPLAADMTGAIYAEGKGMPHNYPEAIKWYQMAANEGDVSAEYWLGICYTKDSPGQDLKKAIEHIQNSADKNYAKAEAALGAIYSTLA